MSEYASVYLLVMGKEVQCGWIGRQAGEFTNLVGRWDLPQYSRHKGKYKNFAN